MSVSLDHRRDSRTPSEFFDDVAYGTWRENWLMDEWAASRPGVVRHRRLAEGGDGRPLKFSSATPDFLLHCDGEPLLPRGDSPVECKYSPCLYKATFKVHELQTYGSHKASILLVWGRGKEDPRRWTIVTTEQIWGMLDGDGLEVRRDYRGMGGKPAVCVMEEQFGEFFGTIYPWKV